MKAVVLTKPGDANTFEYKEVATPEVKPGWSLIKIKGFGINRSEIFTRNGWSPDVKLPRILGIEGVGKIADTTDAKRLPKGQKVVTLMGGMGRAFDGSYAEYALIPNDNIYPVKTNLDWADLAAIPETYFTAYGSLLNLKLQKNDTLLVRGATSGVGVAAVKLAKAMDPSIKVYGTTRNLAKSDELKSVGFDGVFEDKDNELQVGDKHFDKILELIGCLTLTNSSSALNEGGILCLTGELGGIWTIKDFDPMGAIPSGTYLTSFGSNSITEAKFNNLLKLIEDHSLDVSPTKTFDLDHTGDAQAFLDSQHSFGKVVVLP
ncbi:Bifunctional protein: zinc-containing alcohol dehydrogenase [Pediococcus damnosus]|uniref:Bifunctional protein: zinc-containing alcohol dehydrogenase n=1 Tax=Pediococcus damnosus TaxID=51663 RepID=A0A0R2HNL5_9LACO|nr:zinc-binding dehydrogenase [Pediococcus damnosus]AMV60361.1 Bifunctional protein: zinc-containing alcohol dehydrogenase [Pediococcus damnosus]AMV63236.1 Bifunctional protein: zinc-containing alcohol dehydrogenase [Pediococcus damnosus]AMV64611.1 Bifunctional protein: zinc-containing alcohol dehydrogenase [Pediococcus damnosus]AMV66867.1 Bifunctional protein: zinc-containing alcohol dehydrogenase [Pediococcus damnosus]AMV69524.1 Bifunctional protein: zinc-containing alcohol dehydrogenase [Pe